MDDFRQSKWWAEYLSNRGWLVDHIKAADGKHKIQVLVVKIGFWPIGMLKVQRAEYDPDFEDLKRIRYKYRAIKRWWNRWRSRIRRVIKRRVSG